MLPSWKKLHRKTADPSRSSNFVSQLHSHVGLLPLQRGRPAKPTRPASRRSGRRCTLRCAPGAPPRHTISQSKSQILEAEQQKGGPTVNGSSMTPMFVERMDVAVVLSVVKHTALPLARPFESVCTLQFQPQSAAEWRRQSAPGIVAGLASDRV